MLAPKRALISVCLQIHVMALQSQRKALAFARGVTQSSMTDSRCTRYSAPPCSQHIARRYLPRWSRITPSCEWLPRLCMGSALVAYSEEIMFRRCARHLFQIYLNDGYALVVVTSMLFGAYHWWTGIGNSVEAVLIGVLLMLFYRRSVALWPVVLAHYLTDVVDFALGEQSPACATELCDRVAETSLTKGNGVPLRTGGQLNRKVKS